MHQVSNAMRPPRKSPLLPNDLPRQKYRSAGENNNQPKQLPL
jgi:hypothetical protein